MAAAYPVSKVTLRRFLLHTQCLLYPEKGRRKAGTDETMDMIRKLECVQLDPVSVVERNQHLVLAARVPGYEPKLLDALLSEGEVFEYWANAACAIPVDDYPIFEPIRNRFRAQVQEPLEKLGSVVDAVLERLDAEGPLPSRVFTSNKRVSGYWDNEIPKTKETSLALNLLLDAGVIRVVHRERTERFFDLTNRTINEQALKEAEMTDERSACDALIEKYIRAYRVFDPRDSRFGWQKMTAADRRAEVDRRIQNGTVVELDVEDVKRPYYLLTEDLDTLESFAYDKTSIAGPITFLPPLDNLLWRRERLVDLFDFDYKWEIYTPQAKRKYGPYTMPMLCGDRLIGRMDPLLDRKNGQLHVRLLELEPGINNTARMKKRIRDALDRFAEFNQVKEIID